jgi:hypothetical protein
MTRCIPKMLAMLIVAIACASDGRNRVESSAATQQLDSTLMVAGDSALVRNAEDVIVVAGRMKEVWPEYWPDTQAFIFVEREYAALLVSPSAPPEGYKRLTAPVALFPHYFWAAHTCGEGTSREWRALSIRTMRRAR